MKKYRVRITEEAYADMEDLYNYIAYNLKSPDTALSQYNRIAQDILTLEFMPERHPFFESVFEQKMGLRRMIVDNYVVFYLIDSDIVTVTDVLYGASNILARLEQRHNSE